MIKPIFNNPANYIANHNYGKHYMTGLEVFQNNKIFGVGLKNYRIEVKNWKYDKASLRLEEFNCFGCVYTPSNTFWDFVWAWDYRLYCFVVFFIFHFTKYFKNENINLHWAGFLFVCTSLLPLLPSGSFLPHTELRCSGWMHLWICLKLNLIISFFKFGQFKIKKQINTYVKHN